MTDKNHENKVGLWERLREIFTKKEVDTYHSKSTLINQHSEESSLEKAVDNINPDMFFQKIPFNVESQEKKPQETPSDENKDTDLPQSKKNPPSTLKG